MTTFIPYSILLLLIALLFVLVPVLRYRPVTRTADSEIRRQKNIEVYEQSLRELEKDIHDGVITADDFDKLKTELQRSFLRDMEDEDRRDQGGRTRTGRLIPLLCLLFIPVFSYSLYEVVGSVRDLQLKDIMAELGAAETAEAQQESLEKLAGYLQDRFDRHDDDIQNGYMLGTLYLELEHFDAATETFRAIADELEPGLDKATVLGQFAQALYLAADSQMTDEVRQAMNEALSMNPNEFAVMSILAIESVLQEDFAGAVGYWRRQLSQLDAGSQQANTLRNRIAQVQALIGDSGADTAAAATGASVSLVVDIDDSIRDQVGDFRSLFVYASRAGGGPPLAAQNLPIGEFPFTIMLDDSMAMIAGNNLSSADNIVVGARLSRSGQANAQPGDIQAISEPFLYAEQEGPVHLVINEIVQ